MVNFYVAKFKDFVAKRRSTIKSIGMIASADLIGTVLGIVGSMVQAQFITPDDLGFVRKYSVITSYAVFLTLGLFTILQREYPVLVGRGEQEKARRVAAIGHSWSLLISGLVCGGLTIFTLIRLLQGDWRGASALLIQIVSVWATIYGGYLVCTFRSGHEFERLAKSSLLASISGLIVLPLFTVVPFAALVLRSVAGPLVALTYQHAVRPLRVDWYLPFGEFIPLVKRGLRLFAGTYLRYQFWLTVEVLLMVRFAGDAGVGLFVFSTIFTSAVGQFATAVNQIYTPRLAQHFGKTECLESCLKMAIKPAMVNVLAAVACSAVAWFIFPPLLNYAFPKYVAAIPLIKVLLLDTIIVGLSLPLYMVAVLEDYRTQIAAAVIGLAVFACVAYLLHANGMRELSVVWGTISGRFTFMVISYVSLTYRLKKTRAVSQSPQ